MLRARVGAEFLLAMPAALAHAASLTALPLLVVHGEDDKLCDISGSRALLEACAGNRDMELKAYPGLQHELHNERGALEEGGAVDYVGAWLDAHLDSRSLPENYRNM